MKTGIDIGYSDVKALTQKRKTSFPSVIGTPTRERFSINGQQNDIVLMTDRRNWLVGHSAVQYSRFVFRREDRSWIESEEYLILALAALTELTNANFVEVQIVTGLPVAYFADRDRVVDRLKGEHRVQRAGRTAQLLKVSDVRVVPQPFGAILAEALDLQGALTDTSLTGRVGVIDIGGKTTNLLSVYKLAEIPTETTSINLGAWDIIRQFRDYLSEIFPDLELRDHELVEVLRERQIKIAGKTVDLPALDEILSPFTEQIIATAKQLWGEALRLDTILITGGGAHLVGTEVQRKFRQARIVDDPVYANALGFYKLAQRLK